MLISFVAGFAVALYYCWPLALSMGDFAGCNRNNGVNIGQLLQASTESTEKAGHASSVAQEALGAVRTLFSLGLQASSIKRYSNASGEAANAEIRRFYYQACTVGAVVLCMYCTYSCGLYFGAFLIWSEMEEDIKMHLLRRRINL